ncbi:MAG TPA: M1 family aminopeptidase [Chitinophagaceae bacterium]|nr:M1 family aminopeptidase [Chitinophagaceae bacterium]
MHKGIFAYCFILFFNSLFAQSTIDVLHYKFKIELNDQNDTIKGTARIRFILKQLNGPFNFDLTAINGKGKGMIVTNVSLASSSRISFQQANDEITITAPSCKQGDTLDAVIAYKGIPADGLIISKNKYGDRTFFADNWPTRAHNWIPCKDQPDDKATFEFIVTAPAHYEVISNGRKTEEKIINPNKKLTHWVEDIPLSTKIMVIGVARFAVKEYKDSPPGIPISAWVYPQDSTTGFSNYSVAPAILKFLSNYIAPYPYNKLANVESKTIYGGMENASCIFYEESSASSPQGAESLLAHEISHQWFGDMASEKTFAHLWLSEGFATYLTHLYIANKYGIDSMNNEMKVDRQQVISFAKRSGHPVVDSISQPKFLLNPNSYQRGSWVLHMLHRQSGDSVFKQIIRSYYEKYKGANANTRDFELVAENVSGINLKVFFDQWLYRSSIPQLRIDWHYSDTEKKITLTLEQLQASEAFQFPLDILVNTTAEDSMIHTINITQKKQIFNFPLNSKPTSVVADPFTSLLFEGTVKEIK